MGTIRIAPNNKLAGALFPTSVTQNGKKYILRAISTTIKRGIGESIIGKLEGKRTITKLRKVLLVYEHPTRESTKVIRRKKTKRKKKK